MRDRRSRYPGRVNIASVPGLSGVYDITRADDPVDEGTPLNSATLLGNTTAQELGLDPYTATPNDAIKALHSKEKIYTGQVRLDGWSQGYDNWTQTVTVAGVTSNLSLGAPWIQKTGYKLTDEKMQEVLNAVNAGLVQTMNGSVLLTVYENPPRSDAEIRWRRGSN